MHYHRTLSIIFLSLIFSVSCTTESKKYDLEKFRNRALTPPLGWNSFDCYDWRINEEEYRANVDYLSENLLPYGYEYAVVDYLWFHIDPEGDIPYTEREFKSKYLEYANDGTPIDSISIDEFGRVLPDEIRFPSAKGGKGFKPLADYVHSKGLKFGIHIMRGIPRWAVYKDLPIKGTEYTARDIAQVRDTCIWQNSFYGIDHTKPGAQEYYDSIIELYTEWGVDYIKADDMMYPEFHKKEIEMVSSAVKRSKRSIVLSLSLGEVPFHHADFLTESAHLWRISNDFWDNWEDLERAFDLVNYWSNHRGPGYWPDADMLPVGHISLNNRPRGEERMSNFTRAEHYTLMTLWSIAKSPLMIGSNLPTMPDSTFEFLSDKDVLYVNQHSINNRMVYKDWQGNVVWMADDPNSDDLFLALFNKSDTARDVHFNFDWEYLKGKYSIEDLWHDEDLGVFELEFRKKLPGHGAGLYKLSKTM